MENFEDFLENGKYLEKYGHFPWAPSAEEALLNINLAFASLQASNFKRPDGSEEYWKGYYDGLKYADKEFRLVAGFDWQKFISRNHEIIMDHYDSRKKVALKYGWWEECGPKPINEED